MSDAEKVHILALKEEKVEMNDIVCQTGREETILLEGRLPWLIGCNVLPQHPQTLMDKRKYKNWSASEERGIKEQFITAVELKKKTS